jgi:hypothetical protein
VSKKTKKKVVGPFVAPLRFCDSTAGPGFSNRREDEEGQPLVGREIAFFMSLPKSKGGDDWYVGKVGKVGKQDHWTDVEFEDGKLWCKLLPSDRGELGRWVLLHKP